VELLQIILINYCDTYVRATNTINYCVEPHQSFGQAATNLRIICGLLQIILIKYCDTYVRATNTINYCVEPRQSFGQAATNLRIICGAAANNFDKIL
jgi:hypothetical protein